MFLVIVFSNIFFMVYWAYSMYLEMKVQIRTKMERFYLILCLCGNREKLDKEKEDQVKIDNHEILREKFMKCIKKIKVSYENG
jgi:hypothetical protein